MQTLGVPFAALVSIIFGLMLLSLPMGAYVVFETEIGDEINYEYPVYDLGVFLAGISFEAPIYLDLGSTFVIFWSVYTVIFAIAMLGPGRNLFRALASIIDKGVAGGNYMMTAIAWFVILVLVSYGINATLESFGVIVQAPPAENDLVRFVDVTKAPLVEEVGFRVILIGIPLYLMYSQRASLSGFLKGLWHPSRHVKEHNKAVTIGLISAAAVFFGAAHVISGEPWSSAKIVQATATGMIIGWVYFKHGLAPALLIHWAANYFVFSYAYIVSEIGAMTIEEAFSHSMMQTIEVILVVTGVLTAVMMALRHYNVKKLEV